MFTFDLTNGGHSNKINAIVSLGNQIFATGSQDYSIRIWDASICKLQFIFDCNNGGHTNAVTVLGNFFYGYFFKALWVMV